ncbi:MAG: hypothetical protein LBV02_01390 [Bacteroidales bacterium]|nr:hypothetical protein [Bacteroidales bacterium]
MNLQGQEETVFPPDTLSETIFTLDTSVVDFSPGDSISFVLGDSISPTQQDSMPHLKYKLSKDAIEKTVTYNARDSIIIDIKERKAYLYYEARVLYDDVELQADYIEIDFKNNELYASGIADEEGVVTGSPMLNQAGTEIRSQELRYNFTTRKGKISNVITTEGEGFIHGEQVKRLDECSYIRKGKYTTCNLEEPHFHIAFNRAKVIPGDKIVTGVAYLSFAGIPSFLGIPFGFFPNKTGRSSGIVIPSFHESANMGFAFEGLGYYFGISDNVDLLLTADIFTRGSWAFRGKSNYVFRYKCKGDVELSFAQNLMGERYTPSFSKTNNFKVYWNHQQDSKFHPTTRFSAHVNFVTKTYNKYNPTSANDFLTNEYSSAMSLSSSIRSFFFFDAALSYKQNTQTGNVNIGLPTVSMSVNQMNPFRRKNRSGAAKWYENITIRWNSLMSNQINTLDSLLLLPQTWRESNVAMQHQIPLTIPVKLGRAFNWNTSVNFTERIYFQKNYINFSTVTDTAGIEKGVETNVFDRSVSALHDLNLTTALKTQIFFMYQYRKGGLKAIRHVMTPELSFSMKPALNKNMDATYINTITGETVTYSLFSGATYGVPSTRTQALANISIGNNVEIKVRSSKDSSGTKKIAIFDNITFSTNYDFLADSMPWNYLSISGRSTLFKRLTISFSFNFDPYVRDSTGRIATTVWEASNKKRIFRMSTTNINVGLSFTIDKNLFSSKTSNEEPEKQTDNTMDYNSLGMSTKRPDFSNPWSLTFNYNFAYNLTDNQRYYQNLIHEKKYTQNMVHTIAVIGDVSLTKKWKLGFSSGYDFISKKMTYTSFDIYRDLHCWEMRFNWVPFGFQKGFSFTINVKASVLQDLKYNLKRDFRDYADY